MKYFITEQERERIGSTCYHEFQKGEWEWNPDVQVFWKDDFINLDAITIHKVGFESLIKEVIPEYDRFGVTIVTKQSWDSIKRIAAERGGELLELVCEADVWAQKAFAEYEAFSIIGL